MNPSNSMTVTINQAAQAIKIYLAAGLVPLVTGSPGVGKSCIIQAVGKSHDLKIIDLRLAQCDPVDLHGFPHVVNGKATYIPMDTFPLTDTPLPNGKKGWLLFLDELTGAPPAVQLAAYKLILDRKVGLHDLHEQVYIVAAGNLETDNAVVEPMSTALQSRLVHLEVRVDREEWLEWAADTGIDHRIRSYLNFRTDKLYTFSPDHTDKTYACPRTWEFANKVLQEIDINDKLSMPILAGIISLPVALEFLEFCRIKLPDIADIISDPENHYIPDSPNILFALSGALGHYINVDNAAELFKYIFRLPMEFQILTLHDSIRLKPAIGTMPQIKKNWVPNSAKYFK